MSEMLTLSQIQKTIHEFRKARDWLGLDPADLAKSIVIEAAELLEMYQWKNSEDGKWNHHQEKEKIESEVADVFVYLLEFCEETEIDLLAATMKKIEHNKKKYPVKMLKEQGRDGYMKAKADYRKKE